MKAEYNEWILSQAEAIENLQNTKLNFLTYSDLIYTNSLFWKIEEVSNKELKRTCIPNWYYYQNRELELCKEDFFRFFFSDMRGEEFSFLITDEGHVKGWVFQFFVKDFIRFSEWYEDYFGKVFFDFSDYLVVFPKLNMIRLLDEEGGINQLVVF
ncbi:MAG: hypothetical protein J7623_15965 [Chitinophaga sp.]|uniref:hypothetical protein n=1 Tax=Chitinophaga sp. TaxID=1869181 RepID=UPI001B2F0DCD|nr:hypothetical protein [Chitinophaga sp.]MBO9730135.1 hypothetical protein [Chitinophaga sp.]